MICLGLVGPGLLHGGVKNKAQSFSRITYPCRLLGTRFLTLPRSAYRDWLVEVNQFLEESNRSVISIHILDVLMA